MRVGKVLFVSAILVVALIFAAPARANVITSFVPYEWDFDQPPSQGPTIAELLSDYGGQMIVGDKMFSFYNDSVTTTKTVGTVAPNADAIAVSGVQILGDYGLRFNGGWSAGGQEIADTTLLFKVTIIEPELSQGFLIKDNALWISAFGVSGTGDGGIVSVSENVYVQNPRELPPNLNPPIANKFVYYRTDQDMELYDERDFVNPNGPDALPEIWVLKDIVANGGDLTTGSAHLSEFYQTFSQVPEPTTIALLGMGGAALLGIARRRRSR
jgi:hypothetical protein